MVNSPSRLRKSTKVLVAVLLVVYLVPLVIYGMAAPMANGNKPVGYALTIVGELVVGVCAIWALRTEEFSLNRLGLNWSRLPQALILAAIMWLLFGILIIPLSLLAGESPLDIIGNPAIIVQQWLFVGLAEELLFRGYLLTRFSQAAKGKASLLKKGAALVLANGIFATGHLPVTLYQQAQGIRPEGPDVMLLNIAGIFVAGLAFSYFYLRLNNLWLAALLHGGWNAPLIGTKGDFALAFVFVVVVEAAHFVQERRPQAQPRLRGSATNRPLENA